MTQPEIVSAGVQEAADTGKRLGLTWTLRPGRVSAADPLTVVHDGDPLQTKIGMVSLIGYLSVGTRVMTEFVPPAGNYVVGFFAGGNVGRPTYLQYGIATGDTNVTNVEAVVPGLSFTIPTLANGARWEAEGTYDFEETVAGGTTCIGRLYVDGVQAAATATFKMASTNDRGTVGQTWAGTLTASGAHTFEARVVRSAAAGTQVANQTNTTLKVKVYE